MITEDMTSSLVLLNELLCWPEMAMTRYKSFNGKKHVTFFEKFADLFWPLMQDFFLSII